MKIYVNAELNGTMAKSGTIAEYPTDVHIGAGIYSDAQVVYINGTIDEVKIYNKALSAEEIKADYEAGVDSTYPRYDVNEDDKVDILDTTIVGQHFGEITS
jgi:hypothetical protein